MHAQGGGHRVERLIEALHGVLRRAVRVIEGLTDHTGDARDGDDVTVSCPPHDREGGLSGSRHTQKVDIEGPL